MTHALQFDGSNDYLTIPATQMHAWLSTPEWEYEIALKMPTGSGVSYLMGRGADTKGSIYINNSSVLITYDTGSSVPVNCTLPYDGEFHTINISREASSDTHRVYLDGTLVGSNVDTAQGVGFQTEQLFAAGGVETRAIQLQSLKYRTTIGGDDVYHWSANDSDTGSGTVVLEEVVANRDATGVNMPTNGDAWVLAFPPTNYNDWLSYKSLLGSTTEKLISFLQDKGMSGGLTEMMYEYIKTKSSKNSHSERYQEWKDGGYN